MALPKVQKEIFISYAWGGESERFVDRIGAVFSGAGYLITRDKSHLNYRHSIRQYMDRLGQGKYIIVVVSDKYMKSEYCMYEAYRMFQSPEFRKRVYPIVLHDADVFSFSGQQSYVRYWIDKVREVETEIKSLASEEPAMVGPLIERLRDYEATSRFVNDFMANIADMNVMTAEMHESSNFQELLQKVGKETPSQPVSLAHPSRAAPEKSGASFFERWWRFGGLVLVVIGAFLLATLNPCTGGPLLGILALAYLGMEHLFQRRFKAGGIYLFSAALLPFSECGLIILRDLTFYINVLLWFVLPLIVLYEFFLAARGERGRPQQPTAYPG